MGFNVHDIPNSTDCAKDATKPLSYIASLPITPKRKVCRYPVLPKVRAILSWQAIPTAGNANYPAGLGECVHDHVQIKPFVRNFAAAVDLVAVATGTKIDIPPQFEEIGDIPIPLPDPPDPPIAVLTKLYAPTSAKQQVAQLVPSHRFGLAQVHAAIENVTVDQQILTSTASEWKLAGLDFAGALAALDKTKADVTYEELQCLGLDSNTETLAATLRVKLAAGYSGLPCDPGSYEYVAFWAVGQHVRTPIWTPSDQRARLQPGFSGRLVMLVLLKVDLDKYRRARDRRSRASGRYFPKTPPSPSSRRSELLG
jgi:hypothetical protein